MTREECISTLKGCMELMLFDPSTGEVNTPESLNDLNKTTYEALETAVDLLEDNEQIPEQAPAHNGFWLFTTGIKMAIGELRTKEQKGCQNE